MTYVPRSKPAREKRPCSTSLKRKTRHYKDRWVNAHSLSQISVIQSILLFMFYVLYMCFQVTQLTDKLKNQSESNKQAQDNLHKQVQEQKTLLRSAQDRAHTMETTVTELTAQLTDSKEKVSQLDAQVAHVFKQYGYFPLLPKKNM